MNRRTLLILIVVAVLVVAGGVGVYLYLQRDTTITEDGATTPIIGTEDIRVKLTETELLEGKTETEKIREVESSQSPDRVDFEDVDEVTVRKIIDTAVLDPILSADGDRILYFDKDTSEFQQSGRDGLGAVPISSADFNSVHDVRWAGSRDKAIVRFENEIGTVVRAVTFDFNTQQFNDLGQNVTEAALSPDGSKIVYFFKDETTGVSNISVANFDGSNWKIVRPFEQDSLLMSWPSTFRFMMSDYPTSYDSNSLYTLDITGEDLSTVVGDSYGVSHITSPDGKRVLYTATTARGSETFLYAKNLETGEELDLETSTLADKCAFSPDNITVFCGVPQRSNLEFVMPDDYYDRNFVTEDAFFKIDTQTGEKTRLAGPAEFKFTYDAFDPFISSTGRTMYFVRRQDNALYALITPEGI